MHVNNQMVARTFSLTSQINRTYSIISWCSKNTGQVILVCLVFSCWNLLNHEALGYVLNIVGKSSINSDATRYMVLMNIGTII